MNYPPGKDSCDRWLALLLACVMFTVTASPSLLADAYDDRRALVGLNLFRTFLSADPLLARKVSDGCLRVVMLFVDSQRSADDMAERLRTSLQKGVADQPVCVTSEPLSQLHTDQHNAAIFVSERLNDDERQQLVQYGIRQRIAVFSPFEGDVERGILGGISVEASVRPAINRTTLNASGIELKSFYLSVARIYE